MGEKVKKIIVIASLISTRFGRERISPIKCRHPSQAIFGIILDGWAMVKTIKPFCF